MDERLGRGHGRLVVVAEPAVAAKPGEGPLDAPQRLERDEPVGSFGTSPDVDRICVAVPSGWTAMTPGALRVEKFGFEQPSQPGFVTFGRPAQFNDQQMVKLGTG